MRRDAVCVISYTRRPRASLAPRQLVRAERIAGELEVAARLRLRARAGGTRDARERRTSGREARDANERTSEGGEPINRRREIEGENIRDSTDRDEGWGRASSSDDAADANAKARREGLAGVGDGGRDFAPSAVGGDGDVVFVDDDAAGL